MNKTTHEKLCLAVVLNRVCEGIGGSREQSGDKDDCILHQDVRGAVEMARFLMYNGQNFLFRFSIPLYGKVQMNFLANPILGGSTKWLC